MNRYLATACSPLFQPAMAGGVAFLQPRLLGYSAQEGAPSHSAAEHAAQSEENPSATKRLKHLSVQVQQADRELWEAIADLSNPETPAQEMERLLQAGVPLVEYTDKLGALRLGVMGTNHSGERAYFDASGLVSKPPIWGAASADKIGSIKPYRADHFDANEADSFNLPYQGALKIIKSVSSSL